MPHSHFIQANGLRLHYFRRPADGPTVLFLHGLTDGGIYWTPVIEALGAGYDVIAPDARGHGKSDAPASGYSTQDHVNDVAAFVRALDLHQPIVIGHSMGGIVATAFAAQHPALVRAAAFEDPAWLDLSLMPTSTFRKARADDWRRDLQVNHTLTFDALMAKCRAEHAPWSDEEVRLWATTKQQARMQVLDFVEYAPPDWRAMLKEISCPSLLVTGDVSRGVIISPELAAEAQALNAQLRVAHVPNAGHSIHRDNFAGYMVAVKSFLKSLVD